MDDDDCGDDDDEDGGNDDDGGDDENVGDDDDDGGGDNDDDHDEMSCWFSKIAQQKKYWKAGFFIKRLLLQKLLVECFFSTYPRFLRYIQHKVTNIFRNKYIYSSCKSYLCNVFECTLGFLKQIYTIQCIAGFIQTYIHLAKSTHGMLFNIP